MKTIKIRTRTYEIRKGDYIFSNGSCHMFCTGDKRVLKYDKYGRQTCLEIPKNRLKEIPFDEMRKTRGNYHGIKLTYWYF